MKVHDTESCLAVPVCPQTRDRESGVNVGTNLKAVYEQQARFVWRVLRGMGVSDSMVEDAVQDVFMVVQRRLDAFDHRYSIKTWLFEIAYRVACNYRRKEKRMRQCRPFDDQLHDKSPSPADSVELAQQLRVLEELLDELDDNKRAVLILAEIEQMTVPEIAEVTGRNPNTIYSDLRRARQKLNKSLVARNGRKP